MSAETRFESLYRAHTGVLTATTGQPAPHAGDARILAAGDTTAYLEVFRVARPARRYATHDGGRTWSRTGSACSTGSGDDTLAADGPDSLWEQCLVGRSQFVVAQHEPGRLPHLRRRRALVRNRDRAPTALNAAAR